MISKILDEIMAELKFMRRAQVILSTETKLSNKWKHCVLTK